MMLEKGMQPELRGIGAMKRKKGKGYQSVRMVICSVAASCAMAFAAGAETGAAASEMAVKYEDLSRLVQEGNISLRQVIEDYEGNKQTYQNLLDTLREEQSAMKFLAGQYEDDEEAKSVYTANASALANSARQISSRIESLNRKNSTRSMETSIDMYTQIAQNYMNSYNQMVQNLDAQQKEAQAAEASYQAAVARQTAGSATAADVLAASESLMMARNSLSSYQQQAEQFRFNLLSLLGLEGVENVVIGSIPAPDLAAIDAIDIETDKWIAVNNSSSVQNARHSNAGTTTEIQQRFSSVAEAEGMAEADIIACYYDLMASKASYQAAEEAFESATLVWQGIQRQQQAGLVNAKEYLEGEAAYLSARAEKDTASMNLVQAYETYCWEVKGIS